MARTILVDGRGGEGRGGEEEAARDGMGMLGLGWVGLKGKKRDRRSRPGSFLMLKRRFTFLMAFMVVGEGLLAWGERAR